MEYTPPPQHPESEPGSPQPPPLYEPAAPTYPPQAPHPYPYPNAAPPPQYASAPPPQYASAPPPYGYAPQPYVYPYAAPPKKDSGCLTCFIILLVLSILSCCCLAALGVGGYFLLQSGAISQRKIMEMAGRAPGEVSILNLSDESLSVRLTTLEVKDDTQKPLLETFSVNTLEMDGTELGPGRFRVDFTPRTAKPASCTLRLESGEVYQFTATTKGFLVTNEKRPAKSGSDLKVETSPLCKQ